MAQSIQALREIDVNASGIVEEMCYFCICEPIANVAVEIISDLVKGKNLELIQSMDGSGSNLFQEIN